MKKLFLSAIFLVILLSGPKLAFASTLHLSPGSGNVSVGGTIAVRVNINTGGEGINGVSAFLTYPSDKLEVAYVTAGSSFAIEAEKSFGGGSIRISRGSISPVSGNVSVATIGFRGKALGSATVSFIGGSAAPRASDSSDSLNLGASSGGVYNVVQQAAAAPSNQKAEVIKITPTPASAIQQISERPKISDVEVINLGTNNATLTWKTDKPTDSLVEYGLESGEYFITAQENNLVTEHSLDLPSQILTPGTKFYFRILGKDTSGNTGQSDEMDFRLLEEVETSNSNLKSFVGFGIIIVSILMIASILAFVFWKKKKRKVTPPNLPNL